MSGGPLVPIVLGHNAFFGVDHLSAARGAERAAHFSDPKGILSVIRSAAERGAQGLMMSTHERAELLTDLLRADPVLGRKLRMYPLLPYAQKYVTKANEMGLVNVVFDALSATTVRDKVTMGWQVAKGVLTKDAFSMIAALVRLELKQFRELDVGAVFLHDVLTDLLLALNLRPVFEFYIEEIARTHKSRGTFATKNLPLLLKRFAEWRLSKPVVMTHFNKVGYHMNPSMAACEEAAREHPVDIMAMGTLASGFLKPKEAYEYLASVPNIKSVVVGVSSPEHIEETFSAIAGMRLAA
jgi:hypothetical protein